MQGKGVALFAVCAQPQEFVDQIETDLGLTFSCYSDIPHKLRNYLDTEGYITVKVSGGEGSNDSNFYKVHPEIRKYKYGVVQPAVLCITKEKKVLFAWAIDPSAMNIGGASDRPVPTDIWQAVMQKLNNPTDDTPIDSSQLRVHGARSICTII